MGAPWMAIMEKIKGRSSERKADAADGDMGSALNPLPSEVKGIGKKSKADAAMPGREDPEERAALNYTKRQRRAFQTGTAMEANRNSVAAMMQSGMNKSITAGGGTRGLNMMQAMFNQSMLGIAQESNDKALQYGQEATRQLTRISQRKLELGMLKYTELQKREAEKDRAKKEEEGTQESSGGGLSSMMSGMLGGGAGGAESGGADAAGGGMMSAGGAGM